MDADCVDRVVGIVLVVADFYESGRDFGAVGRLSHENGDEEDHDIGEAVPEFQTGLHFNDIFHGFAPFRTVVDCFIDLGKISEYHRIVLYSDKNVKLLKTGLFLVIYRYDYGN